jgi:SAM-dependent methyltransferase
MLMVAAEHIRASGLVRKIVPVLGDVHAMPFDDSTVDLVVSRGSWFFWDDLGCAFKEIHRVLAPGGQACIGGGFGNARLKEEIHRTMSQRGPAWEKGVQERSQKNNPDRIREELGKAGISSYHFIQDETGFWAVIAKE